MVPVEGVEGVYKVAFESLWENCFSEMGYREFKRDLYNGNLFEGVRAAAVGKHDVLLKESAADICSKLASLLKSLKDLLTVSLYGNKGKFEEDDLRSIFAAYDMDVPSAKRFITSLLESRVEEGRSVSYITSAKKKDEDKLMFTVTRGFDLLLVPLPEVVCPAYYRKERRPAVVLCHSVLRSQYVAQLAVYAQCGGLYRRGGCSFCWSACS